ncbi:MAG: PleD family two-component system response regulator [Vampirovibrionia bacterium]
MVEHLSKKILILGDSMCDKFNFKKAFQHMLQKQGYGIILYSNSLNAMELIEIEQPDLIIMDVHMRYNCGLELLQQIKANRKISHIPFIAMTSLKYSGKLASALKLGATDYFIKNGITPNIVNSKIRKIFVKETAAA